MIIIWHAHTLTHRHTHTHTHTLSTDLDDSPLLHDDGVIGRRRGASLLIHKQALQ